MISFTLGEILGEGNFGKVVIANKINSTFKVAIKIIAKDFHNKSEKE